MGGGVHTHARLDGQEESGQHPTTNRFIPSVLPVEGGNDGDHNAGPGQTKQSTEQAEHDVFQLTADSDSTEKEENVDGEDEERIGSSQHGDRFNDDREGAEKGGERGGGQTFNIGPLCRHGQEEMMSRGIFNFSFIVLFTILLLPPSKEPMPNLTQNPIYQSRKNPVKRTRRKAKTNSIILPRRIF